VSIKYKSEYIAKDKVRVTIETTRERIEGFIHVLFRHRPSDLLNDETRFIPVTEALITPYDAAAKPWQADFIALNKDHIVLMREDAPGSLSDDRGGQ